MQLLRTYQITSVLDVGANTGIFGLEVRKLGYKGNMVSFEPLKSAFQELAGFAGKDGAWRAMNCALGSTDTTATINVSGNSCSSSLLDVLDAHTQSAPQSTYVGKEEISVRKLDSIINDICQPNDNIFLKIDTQGYEGEVLKGAEKSLTRISTIQVEMSLVPLYKDGILFQDLFRMISEKGYVLVAVEPGFSDRKTGQMLQMDGIFHRF
jgi:FkbM family methyltransferase